MSGNDRTNKKTSGRSVADEFGSAVAISGDYAVVGSRYDDEDSLGLNPVKNSGAAFIFHKVEGKWQKVRKINASGRITEAYFGCAVAIHGNYIVVGAHKETESQFNSAGAAYVFEKDKGGTDNWGEVKRIVAPVRTERYGDAFGFSVGISNDYVIVGAPWEDQDSQESNTINDSGSAYIYKRDNGGTNNWGIVKKITAPVRGAGDSFGYSVSISNDYAVVGANWEGEDANEGNTIPRSGSAYLFDRFVDGENNWGLVKKLTAAARSEHAYFGGAVSIDGNFVIVGSSGANGSAYVFEKDWGAFNNWGQVKKLLAPVEEAGAEFGVAVAINGHRAIVGSRSKDYRMNNPDAGAAYVFKKDQGDSNNWGLLREVNASGSSSGDYFGTSVAISGENALVGAVGESGDDHENLTVKSAGSAYFFTGDYSGPDSWNLLQKVTASTGATPSSFQGRLSISGDYAIMGAPSDGDSNGQNPAPFAGAAYIMHTNTGNGVQVKKIFAPDRDEGDAFGSSVGISGEYAVVGAMRQANGIGAVYIFKKDLGGANNWGFLKKITSSVPTTDDWFGVSVGISGDHVIVGAFGEDEDESEGNKLNTSGAAYIFNKDQGGSDNWGLVKKITVEKRLADLQLGSAVSISGDYAIAGAIGDDYDESDANFIDNSGAAYIFKKDQGGINNWGQVKKLVASERTSGSQFGIGLAISGENVIVGAPAGYVWDASSVYIYSKNSGGTDRWGMQKSLRGAEKAAGAKVQASTIEKFGRTVGISDDYAVVGTSRLGLDSLGRAVDYGYDAAYVFGKNKGGTNNWGLSQTLISKDSVRGDAFASSVAISAKYIVATAPGDDEDANGDNTISNSGSVYFFINSATPLPVTLISFDAGKVENQVLLKWITSFESNSDYFEIQKSADARNWEVIGNLSAARESSSQQFYSFTDAKPFAGSNLYRLKMVDRDGTFAFSRIRSLSFKSENETVLYPNPVSEILHIRSDTGKVESVKMTNALGQMVFELNNIPEGGISLEHLATGVYLIQVKKADGGTTSQKIVIAR